MSQPDSRNRMPFLLLCAACVLGSIAFGIVAAKRSKSDTATSAARNVVGAEAAKTSQEPGTAGDLLGSARSPNEPARRESNKAPQLRKSLAPTLVPKPLSPLVFFRASALGANYDQVEWLDNDQILYALSENEKGLSASTDIWVLPASAGGSPHILLQGGFSPAVVPRNP